MSAPFTDDFVTLNEYHTDITLNNIDSGITISGIVTVKYVMINDTVKTYTVMVEAYWVPELKHQLVSPQYIHTEEGNPMSTNSLWIWGRGYTCLFDGQAQGKGVPQVAGYPDYHDAIQLPE